MGHGSAGGKARDFDPPAGAPRRSRWTITAAPIPRARHSRGRPPPPIHGKFPSRLPPSRLRRSSFGRQRCHPCRRPARRLTFRHPRHHVYPRSRRRATALRRRSRTPARPAFAPRDHRPLSTPPSRYPPRGLRSTTPFGRIHAESAAGHPTATTHSPSTCAAVPVTRRGSPFAPTTKGPPSAPDPPHARPSTSPPGRAAPNFVFRRHTRTARAATATGNFPRLLAAAPASDRISPLTVALDDGRFAALAMLHAYPWTIILVGGDPGQLLQGS